MYVAQAGGHGARHTSVRQALTVQMVRVRGGGHDGVPERRVGPAAHPSDPLHPLQGDERQGGGGARARVADRAARLHERLGNNKLGYRGQRQ